MNHYYELTTSYVLTNVIAILVTIVTMIRPQAGRVFFGGLFIGAAAFNGVMVLLNPVAYMTFENLAILETYRFFIKHIFVQQIAFYILLIAVAQGMIGTCLLYTNLFTRLATVGAIIFFIGIAPLGEGSAFPSSLILATGMVILWRKQVEFQKIPTKRNTDVA